MACYILLLHIVAAGAILQIDSPHPLESCLGILHTYRQGEFQDAVKALSGWSESRIKEMVRYIVDLREERVRTEQKYHLTLRTDDPYLEAAALLHTGVALGGGRRPVDELGEFHLGVTESISNLIDDPHPASIVPARPAARCGLLLPEHALVRASTRVLRRGSGYTHELNGGVRDGNLVL